MMIEYCIYRTEVLVDSLLNERIFGVDNVEQIAKLVQPG